MKRNWRKWHGGAHKHGVWWRSLFRVFMSNEPIQQNNMRPLTILTIVKLHYNEAEGEDKTTLFKTIQKLSNLTAHIAWCGRGSYHQASKSHFKNLTHSAEGPRKEIKRECTCVNLFFLHKQLIFLVCSTCYTVWLWGAVAHPQSTGSWQ